MLNPDETARAYSAIYGNNIPGFGLSTIGSNRMWRLTTNNPSAHQHWLQIDAGSETTIAGVATQPAPIWSGTMFVQRYHVRYCSSLRADNVTCDAWADARNEAGGVLFDGPQDSGQTIVHNHCSSGCALPSTGSNGLVYAFFDAPVVARLVRIYPFGACTWVCSLRAGLLVFVASG